jgi:hypothetical protein
METIGPMRFVYMFLDFVENHGIFDEFDPEQNCMVTSEGMEELISIAEEIAPERVSNEEAAVRMRELTPVERDILINEDEEGVIVDLRDHFAEKMAENGGARGLLAQLVEAQEQGDSNRCAELWETIEEFAKRENNVSQET